jgi:1-phosphatidylinositol-3-phosphate 5-kinase
LLQLVGKMETLYAEISDVLDSLEEKCKSFGHEWSDTNELQDHIMGLKDLLKKERNDYNVCTHFTYCSHHRVSGP